jgi:hypothetical protein
MSSFPVPPTWVNGSLTAANLNTVSSGIAWLKNAIDLITGSTAADTGDTTLLSVARASSGLVALQAKVTGDANPRFTLGANGGLHWGPATTATDTDLTRSAANELTLSGTLIATRVTLVGNTDVVNINGGYIEIDERIDPAAPSPNTAALYLRDNGSGKSQLAIKFNTGTPIVIATQA